MFHLMFVHYTFSSGWVVEWPPFRKKLSARLAICSHCLLYILFVIFIFSRFGFRSEIWLLIAPVPVYCCSITLITTYCRSIFHQVSC